jgi:hypothetical protein
MPLLLPLRRRLPLLGLLVPFLLFVQWVLGMMLATVQGDEFDDDVTGWEVVQK